MSAYVSLIFFAVEPKLADLFIEAFQESGMLSRPKAVAGFISAELVRELGNPDHFAVVAHWETPAAYAAWQAVAQQGAPHDALRRLAGCIRETAPGKLYASVGA